MKHKVLLIEDDELYAKVVAKALDGNPIDLIRASTAQEGITYYLKSKNSFATVIIDNILPDVNGSVVAQRLRKYNPEQDILFISGNKDPDHLIELLKSGCARNFIYKEQSPEEILSFVLDSIAIYQREKRVLGYDDYEPGRAELKLKAAGIVGRSPIMYAILEQASKYRDSHYPILILGESGTGKELLAQALTPAGKNLIAVNCARYTASENLMESELFGYVKGSFTGANADNVGLVTSAHGQVLFLDEFHLLSLPSQAKLLRFLQEMKYRRVGDNSGREISANFKLIVAAKPVIFEMIERKEFLEDLIHRVGQLQINVPPLRERVEDIEPLVRFFQDEFNATQPASFQKQVRISTVQELAKQNWSSGNVRELQAAVRQMLYDTKGDIASPSDFKAYLDKINKNKNPQPSATLEDSLIKHETEQIIHALTQNQTQTGAAKQLGIPKSSLRRRLIQLGIDATRYLMRSNKRKKREEDEEDDDDEA